MKLFTWDLHGTLEYGNDRLVIDISNQVLADHGYTQRFSYADSSALYGRPWNEYFSWLLEGGDDGRDRLLRDACTAIADENPERYYRQIKPTPHAHAVLRAIADAQHDQILISNARGKTLRTFIRALGYADFFPEERAFAVGGRAKEDALSDYLRTRDEYDELVIIGDTAHDMRLAAVAGGATYLFAHPGSRFPDCPADHQIRDLRHLLGRL
jgi:phosphoglycolate phosphatase-like HAD superfamily hydrolase